MSGMTLHNTPAAASEAVGSSVSLLRRPAFRRLWFSSALESAGDEASRTLIPIIAVSMLGAGAFEVGVINALGLSAFLLFGVPIGVWVDRMRKRGIMITADVGRAAVVAALPAAYLLDALAIWHLFVAVALISVADVCFTTAHSTFLPAIVDGKDLDEAYARLHSAETTITVGTPALSGALLRIVAASLALLTVAGNHHGPIRVLWGP